MTEEDFLVIFSYSGATKDNIYTAKIARQAGAGDRLYHPVPEIASECLL